MSAEPTDTWNTAVDADPSSTIRPADPPSEDDAVVRSLLAAPAGREELRFGETIGTGGMGVVRAAEQVRLGRVVAVKSLRTPADPEAMRRLLDEAWVTGALEHPNIVPVYDIAVDADHRPHLVMKRVSGITWASVMDEPGPRAGALDPLAWNLGILASVCDAICFAHARGVLHRDLKPENIMIGEFGEVYVVDWGIAVAVGEGNPRLPLARAGRVAGTPRYMAPEMVRGEPCTPATDVYLLGGLLYRVLAGRAPHRGLSVKDILASIEGFRPELPEAPAELRALVQDAMRADPAARLATAEGFRERLRTFVAHRGSSELAASAERALGELRGELADARDRVRVHALLAACRFGFGQALLAWPENPVALAGREAALEAVARFELDERDPRAAGLLLAELAAPDPAMLAAVERLRAEREAESAALVRLVDDQDPRIGQRTRVFFVAVFGIGWVIVPVSTWLWWDPLPQIDDQIGFAVGQVVLVGVFVFWARQSLFSTPLNRTTAVLMSLVPGAQLLLHVVLWLAGGSPELAVVFEPFVYAILATVGAFLIHPVAGFAAAAYVLATLGSAVDPGRGLLWAACANTVLTASLLALWLPSMPSEPTLRRS